jgi:hypothetical protein
MPHLPDEVNAVNGQPVQMTIDSFIERLLTRNYTNCREWLGYPINRAAPELPPLDRERYAICTNPDCHHKGKEQESVLMELLLL